MVGKKNKLPVQEFSPKAKTAFRGEFLSIKSEKNKMGYPRVGVVISKKKTRGALARNSLRRKVFNLLRDNFIISNEDKNEDLLVILNQPIMKVDSIVKEKIERDLIEGLKRI